VLIVDDAAENRELLRLLLQETGLVVDEAENGQVGVEKAAAGHYDIILMDVYMPVLDGFAATRKLRQQGLKTSIIALTANAMKGFEAECLDAGYSGYFSKPIDIDRFMEMMAELLGGRPQRLVLPEAEPVASAPSIGSQTREPPAECEVTAAEPLRTTNEPVMSRLGSSPRFQKVILQFIEKLKQELTRAQAAWENGNLEELALIAHWLKGAGGTVGFGHFTEPAARLENFAKTAQLERAGEILRQVKNLSEAIVPPAIPYSRKAA